jgi:indolepyruvate ferredoxin oxidoreductase alpha subunit
MVKNVLLPVNAKKKHVQVEQRLERLVEFGNTCFANRIEWADKKLGAITSGISYQYAKEVFPHASILKLGLTNPLPKKLILNFAKEIERLIVIEELDPFIEEQISALGIKVEGKEKLPLIGELNQTIVAQAFQNYQVKNESVLKEINIPPRPPVLCPGCSHRGMFYAMKKLRLIVTGDIGCYTLGALPPLETTDTCLCMGASIGFAHGMEKVVDEKLNRKIIGVIGDSTFFHSGITGLIDMVYNKSKAKICILDNQITAMTGHQEHPGSGLTLKRQPTVRVSIEAICRAAGVDKVIKVDSYDIKKTISALKEIMQTDASAVIIADAPCVIRERKIFSKPYWVEAETCIACGMCHKVGCPAIEKDENGKTKINPLLCIGCDICRQVCKPQAIQKPA